VLPKYIQPIEPDDNISLDDILAEIAYCYDPANKIRVPATIIGMNLMSGHVPAAAYYGTIKHIPPAILERAGLAHLLAPPPASTPPATLAMTATPTTTTTAQETTVPSRYLVCHGAADVQVVPLTKPDWDLSEPGLPCFPRKVKL
jgi:hypothetical protein